MCSPSSVLTHAGHGQDVATAALLRSIFGTETLTEAQAATVVSTLIELATPQKFVVPKAILMATGRFGWDDVAAAVDSGSMRRLLLDNITGH